MLLSKNAIYYLTQLVVPRLAEATNEGVFQELIDRELQLTAFLYGCVAYAPTMILQAYCAIGELLLAYRIEGTRNGLAPRSTSLTKGFVGGTKAAAFSIIARKDTILAIDDARHEVALAIGVGHALAVDSGLGRSTEFGPHFIEHAFELAYFVECERGATVAFDAALAFAGIEVAAEAFSKNVGRQQYVAHLYNRWYSGHEVMGLLG